MNPSYGGASPLIVFPTVLIGWIFSLCLHEFSHAVVAYRGGDHSVREKGYLSFNPLRYIDPQLSILMPLLFLLIGGLGLPGGAVLINRARLRSPLWQSAVSLAGPLSNALLALILALVLWSAPALRSTSLGAGLAFLTLLQVSSVILNLLPVPGLDGFGIIAPFLPQSVRAQVASFGGGAIMLLFAAMWVVPGLNAAFWRIVFDGAQFLGVDSHLAVSGLRAFQFWR